MNLVYAKKNNYNKCWGQGKKLRIDQELGVIQFHAELSLTCLSNPPNDRCVFLQFICICFKK